MSRVFHAKKNAVFQDREQIEQHLLAKVNKNDGNKIGTELELFVTTPEGLPITYDQIDLLLEDIAEQYKGAKKIVENCGIVGVHLPKLGDVCLEPGGQVELSTIPCAGLYHLEDVNKDLRKILDKSAAFFGLTVKGQGHMPAFLKAEDMPRSRFAAYYRYCRHQLGEENAAELIATMKSVCSLQINHDPGGEDFHEIYRALMLLDTAMQFAQSSPRLDRLHRTYAAFFPEQTTPVFEAFHASSNEEIMVPIVDRILKLKLPFIPDNSAEGFKSSLDLFGEPPTVGELLKKGMLTTEILDNALSLQLTLPNLRRHGVLETRSVDSVDTQDDLDAFVYFQHDHVFYSSENRLRLLDHFKGIDVDQLRDAFINRLKYSRSDFEDLSIGRGLKVRDLIELAEPVLGPSLSQEFKKDKRVKKDYKPRL